MLLRVAVIDDNDAYRTRLTQAFAEDYSDRIEVASFSTLEAFDEYTVNATVDAMLVSESLAQEHLAGRRGATLVYLVSDQMVETLYGQNVVCRYQKVDAIYRGILAACSDRFDRFTARVASLEDTSVITFFPASGGAGASTMAAACAVAAAKRGMKAFYLNLEIYGSTSLFFDSTTEGGLDDILFAIEAKKRGVAVRIQSVTHTSPDGVRFIDSCKNAGDIADLTSEHLLQLVQEIASSDSYDVIVLDLDYAHSPLASTAMALSRRTVFVSNGTTTSNLKFERLYRLLEAQNRTGNADGLNNVVLAYNNFSSKKGRRLSGDVVPTIGGLNRVVAANEQQLIDTLSTSAFFDEILSIGVE